MFELIIIVIVAFAFLYLINLTNKVEKEKHRLDKQREAEEEAKRKELEIIEEKKDRAFRRKIIKNIDYEIKEIKKINSKKIFITILINNKNNMLLEGICFNIKILDEDKKLIKKTCKSKIKKIQANTETILTILITLERPFFSDITNETTEVKIHNVALESDYQ